MSYSRLSDSDSSNGSEGPKENKWCLRRDCKECFGELTIRADNVYSYSSCCGIKYGADCSTCQTRYTIKNRFIPVSVKDAASEGPSVLRPNVTL